MTQLATSDDRKPPKKPPRKPQWPKGSMVTK
jgi:hypothetical protein